MKSPPHANKVKCICFILAVLYSWSHTDQLNQRINSFLQMRAHHFSELAMDKNVTALDNSMQGIPDPIFFTVGNSGYDELMANFMCNMKIFPPIHKHLLVALLDDTSAEYISTFSDSATILSLGNDEASSAAEYNTMQYRELMLTRGLLLLRVLQTAKKQNKTVIWVEPDMLYTQNLLMMEDLMKPNTDISFMWDYWTECGCFIRFPPTEASIMLYHEVMKRMQPSALSFTSKHDQDLLKEVIEEQNSNSKIKINILDPCTYRSGKYLINGFPDDRHTQCSPDAIPAVQHLNWIVGIESKIQTAKNIKGWFLSEDKTTCALHHIH